MKLHHLARACHIKYLAENEEATYAGQVKEFTEDNLKTLLQELGLAAIIQKKERLWANILKLLTPEGSKTPILTLRNIRCILYAIINVSKSWMKIQDPAELNPLQLVYKRKIWKYKILINKLKTSTSEALEFCSKNHLDLLENVNPEKSQKLTEEEKRDLIIRVASFGEGALYKGRSLCVQSVAVARIARAFEPLSKGLYDLVHKQIDKKRQKRERQNAKNKTHCYTLDQYTSNFKPKTAQ